ncbi:MAG: hypothetical protein ABH835_01170 [Patescibacteria group bacterium]
MEEKHASIKKILLFIGFIVFSFIIYIVGVLVGADFGSKNAQIIESVIGSSNENDLCASLIPEEPDEIYAYTGLVAEKGDNYIVIKLQIIENQQLIDKEEKINFNDETKFKKMSLQSIPNEDGEIPEEDISINDILINDTIAASSEENVKNKEEFTAKKITRIIN